MLADRVSLASGAPYLLKFIGECATIPGASRTVLGCDTHRPLA
jgi:hypothetical protein